MSRPIWKIQSERVMGVIGVIRAAPPTLIVVPFVVPPAMPIPAHAAPHIATQCGPPARPIKSAVTASVVCMGFAAQDRQSARVPLMACAGLCNHNTKALLTMAISQKLKNAAV